MFNDEDLMRFTTWIVAQPEYEDSGFVGSANDHGSKTKTVLWAGPQTSLLDRIGGEAAARGIGLAVQRVKYTRADLRCASTAIFAAQASLLEAGFHLSGVEGTNPSHDGLLVKGIDRRSAAGAEELDERLVDAVRVVLSRIPDLRSSIDLADVQITYGKVFFLSTIPLRAAQGQSRCQVVRGRHRAGQPLRDNAVVLDPEEGLNPDGTIRTGVRRQRVPTGFEPLVLAVMEAFGELSDECAELHLYGSVATGMAQLGTSDVDLVAIGVAERWAREIGAALSTRFATVCRGVEIGPGRPADFSGEDDAAYGNRVFLRHYCVPLAGPDVLRRVEPFHGDARAARGFNGDIGRCLEAWRAGAHPRRVARKTLLAAAGVISVHNRTWTTDRYRAARRWAELDPDRSDDMVRLLAWAEGRVVPLAAELDAALEENGVVEVVVGRFATEVGLWPDAAESGSND